MRGGGRKEGDTMDGESGYMTAKNVRMVSLGLLVIGLFLPMISINFLGMSQGISLFDVVTNVSSLSILGDVDDLITLVYVIFLVYLIAMITNALAIFNGSRTYAVISGIFALIYSGVIFAGVLAAKAEIASSADDPFSRTLGSAVASMFNVDIGVGVAFLASILLFGSLMMRKR